MKKLYLLIFVLLFTLTGCTVNKIENIETNYKVNYEDINITDFNQMLEKAIDKASYSSVALMVYRNEFITTKKSLGSGVIISKEVVDEHNFRYIVVTNRHVIEFNNEINISKTSVRIHLSSDENNYIDASILGYDEAVDIALVEFTTNKDLGVAEFAGNDPVKKGSIVFAYGCPYRLEYFGSATMGVVSYENRLLVDSTYGGRDEVQNVYIQHDAHINSGNSGGGLFDIYGNLVGINTQKLTGEKNEIDGIGFAIPLDVIKTLTIYKNNVK